MDKKVSDVIRSRGFLTALAASVIYVGSVGLQEAGWAINPDSINILLGLFGVNIAGYKLQDMIRGRNEAPKG